MQAYSVLLVAHLDSVFSRVSVINILLFVASWLLAVGWAVYALRPLVRVVRTSNMGELSCLLYLHYLQQGRFIVY